MSYELVVKRKEKHILSYHFPKRRTVLKKIDLWYLKVQVSKWTQAKNYMEAKPQKKREQIWVQILHPVTNTEFFAPELEGDQNEMVV